MKYLCTSDWNSWADRPEGCGSGRVGRGWPSINFTGSGSCTGSKPSTGVSTMGVASLLETADLFLFRVVSFTGSTLAVLADVLRLSDMLTRRWVLPCKDRLS